MIFFYSSSRKNKGNIRKVERVNRKVRMGGGKGEAEAERERERGRWGGRGGEG